jgi:polysaccharide deacetylase family sporulation protein PdaB
MGIHNDTILKKCAVALATVCAVVGCTALPVYAVLQKQKTQTVSGAKRSLPIYSVATDEKKIAISFDCAWGVEYTDALLNTMQKYEVRCTFFAVQFWVEKYPEYAKKIVSAGHELGTHSRTHSYMSKQTKEQIQDELNTSREAIAKATGQTTNLFRAPYGDYDDLLVDTAKEMGLYTIQWDVDSLDWKELSADEIFRRVSEKAKDGSICLFHNAAINTPEALPRIIEYLLQNGYEIVPVSQLIYTENYTIDHTGRQWQSAT